MQVDPFSGRTLYAGLVVRPKSWQCPHAGSTNLACLDVAPRRLLVSTTFMDPVWLLPCVMEFSGERLWSQSRRQMCGSRYVRNFGLRTQAEYMLSRARHGNRFSFVDSVHYGLSLVDG